jgi:hypothetical protein
VAAKKAAAHFALLTTPHAHDVESFKKGVRVGDALLRLCVDLH